MTKLREGKAYIIEWIDPVSAISVSLQDMVNTKYPIHECIGWIAKVDGKDIYIQTDSCHSDDIGDFTLIHKSLIISIKRLLKKDEIQISNRNGNKE